MVEAEGDEVVDPVDEEEEMLDEEGQEVVERPGGRVMVGGRRAIGGRGEPIGRRVRWCRSVVSRSTMPLSVPSSGREREGGVGGCFGPLKTLALSSLPLRFQLASESGLHITTANSPLIILRQ